MKRKSLIIYLKIILFYEIIDDYSFELFMNFSQNYIAKRLNDKINRLYLSISRQITESFKNNFRDFNHPHNELINKVKNKTLSKPVEKYVYLNVV